MKLDTNQIEVTTFGGTGEKFEMSIDQDSLSHIMSIMSKLYSNPILAVIREYSTNAYDSHKMAGKENVPIEITLPSRFDSNFSVQDYGIGLTKEEVQNIFSSYGKSTKRDSNDFTGQLGFGSKSAFAYADQFNVTTVKDGMKCYFSFSLNENKVGVASLLGEHPTEEPSGVRVSIPVKLSDIGQFQSTSSEFFKHWRVVPTGVHVKTKKYAEISPGVRMEDNAGVYSSTKTSYVVMGNVAYPIDYYQIPLRNKRIYGSYSTDFGTLLNSGVVLDAEIGDVAFSPSRESLQYNKKTIAWIEQKLVQFSTDLLHYVDTHFSEAGLTIVERHKRYQEFESIFGYVGRAACAGSTTFKAIQPLPSKDTVDFEWFEIIVPDTTSAVLKIKRHSALPLGSASNLPFMEVSEITLVKNPNTGTEEYKILDLPLRKLFKNQRGRTFRATIVPVVDYHARQFGLKLQDRTVLEMDPVPAPPRKAVERYNPLLQFSPSNTGWSNAWFRLQKDASDAPDPGSDVIYVELDGITPTDQRVYNNLGSINMFLKYRDGVILYGIRRSKVEAMSEEYNLITLADYIAEELSAEASKEQNVATLLKNTIPAAKLEEYGVLSGLYGYLEDIKCPNVKSFITKIKDVRKIVENVSWTGEMQTLHTLHKLLSPNSNLTDVVLKKRFPDIEMPDTTYFRDMYPLYKYCVTPLFRQREGIQEFIQYMNLKETA
jgi:hypothetical protein